MKHPVHLYAKALAQAVLEAKGKNDEAIMKNFLAIVRKNGDESHLRKIVEEAARLLRAQSGTRKITIESARPLSALQEKEVKGFVKVGDEVERKIDKDLIAGVRIILNDEMQFDGSLKGKLDNVFKNI